MVTITITTSWSWVTWGAFQASSKVHEDVHLLEVVVQGLTTLVSFCLFILALSLYDFCKQQQYNYNPHGFEKFDFEKKIGATTVTVSREHFVAGEEHKHTDETPLLCEEVKNTSPSGKHNNESDVDPSNKSRGDIRCLDVDEKKESDEISHMDKLRLPTGQVVGATCIICLCNYEPDEQISWAAKAPQKQNSLLLGRREAHSASNNGALNGSQRHRCTHAFHTACFVQYAEACVQRQRSCGRPRTSIPCPLCRSDFVSL